MSNQALNWAYTVAPVTSAERAVLVYLANLADDAKWRCWPSLASICSATCLGRSTVIGVLARLEDAKILERVSRGREGGGRQSNVYCLNRVYSEQGNSPASGPLMSKVQKLDVRGKGPAAGLSKVQSTPGKGPAAGRNPLRTQNIPLPEVITTTREALSVEAEKAQRVPLVRTDNPALFSAAMRIAQPSPALAKFIDSQPEWPFHAEVVEAAIEATKLRIVHDPPSETGSG